MSHGFTKSFVDSSGLGSLMRLWSDGTWGCRHLKCLKRWLGLEDSVPRWHTPRAGIFVLEVIGLSSLLHPSFLEAIWRSLKHISWLLPYQVIQKKEEGGSHSIFYELASEVTPCLFCNILLSAHGSPSSVWKGTTTRSSRPQDGEQGLGSQAAYHIWLAPQCWLFFTFAQSRAMASERSSHLWFLSLWGQVP